LVDTSGTYADQRGPVVDLIQRALLPRMLPGDSLVVARIDGSSFSRDDVIGTVSLDRRPSRANAQKAEFADTLDGFRKDRRRSRYTDIRGGLMLCGEYLAETGAGRRDIVIFSDLKEELPPGSHRELAPAELDGIRVVAMNVKRLRADHQNPTAYRRRLEEWRERLSRTGVAAWRVFLEPEPLLAFLDRGR
jgi:hypothetical protein